MTGAWKLFSGTQNFPVQERRIPHGRTAVFPVGPQFRHLVGIERLSSSSCSVTPARTLAQESC